MAERKSSLSLVLFSSFYYKETVAQRERSQPFNWDSNPGLSLSTPSFSRELHGRKGRHWKYWYNSMREVPSVLTCHSDADGRVIDLILMRRLGRGKLAGRDVLSFGG